MSATFEIFCVAPPGLEAALCAEALEAGFAGAVAGPGGVTFTGGWVDVWRANLTLRGAARVLARIGSFRAMHLAQLDKRSRKFPWGDVLRKDVAVRVEAVCHASRIYHAGAAAQRVATAITEELGAEVLSYTGAKAAEDVDTEDAVALKVRIADDLVTISVDTSGASLHKRGHKGQVGKAPMRENMAALFLRECGYRPGEAVMDPMCGSGTFVIEAAEIAAGLLPGRSRGFAFERLATFDAQGWAAMKGVSAVVEGPVRSFGSDRDDGAIRASIANADRAGVAASCEFRRAAVSDAAPPEGVAPGLVIVNPPYGARIGDRKQLFALYGAFGRVMRDRFGGWRVGLITSDGGLARATGLAFLPMGESVAHGGLRIALYRTDVLPG
jgi:putative N6-adenine-specific DNA methylase